MYPWRVEVWRGRETRVRSILCTCSCSRWASEPVAMETFSFSRVTSLWWWIRNLNTYPPYEGREGKGKRDRGREEGAGAGKRERENDFKHLKLTCRIV